MCGRVRGVLVTDGHATDGEESMMHTGEDDTRHTHTHKRLDTSAVYLSTTTGRSTSTAKPG